MPCASFGEKKLCIKGRSISREAQVRLHPSTGELSGGDRGIRGGFSSSRLQPLPGPAIWILTRQSARSPARRSLMPATPTRRASVMLTKASQLRRRALAIITCDPKQEALAPCESSAAEQRLSGRSREGGCGRLMMDAPPRCLGHDQLPGKAAPQLSPCGFGRVTPKVVRLRGPGYLNLSSASLMWAWHPTSGR